MSKLLLAGLALIGCADGLGAPHNHSINIEVEYRDDAVEILARHAELNCVSHGYSRVEVIGNTYNISTSLVQRAVGMITVTMPVKCIK
jgi:hypothetical protein